MIRYTTGNLLDTEAEALVNTVNTVGVMGKGIALMFREKYLDIFKAYKTACEREEIQTGRMFVTPTGELQGPRFVIHFPTKRHWRPPSKLEWIDEGLADLRRVLIENEIKSVAIPPLGAGNGKLVWSDVRPLIEKHLGDLPDQGIDVLVFEPSRAYHNVSKTTGVEELTPARAMVGEMIRRYEVLGLDCSILEVQKLAWVLNRVVDRLGLKNPLKLRFEANRYGPYSDNLRHLLDALDGSYLHCDKRLADASPLDTIHVAPSHADRLRNYFRGAEKAGWTEAVEQSDAFIDGFQSPLGMEALATVGWLLDEQDVEPTLAAVREGIGQWPHGNDAAERKQRLFGDALLQAALERFLGA
ncbi:MAG: macro domain-containing protein [Planctomycetota bacterium]